jgi:hypothetical protein
LGKVSRVVTKLCVIAPGFFAAAANADEFLFNFGGGPQFGFDQSTQDTDQINKTFGIDYSFYRHDRSPRSGIRIGASYTYMSANSDEYDTIHSVSIYPQLTLYPTDKSWIRSLVPGNTDPFFFVRALGPSYISANRLGSQQQSHNFAFQAQIGVGLQIDQDKDRQIIVALSWKHFSNANLFEDNDGIDLPIVLNFGIRY